MINDPLYQFREAMREAGLLPPEIIEPGKLHRFPGIGKHNGNTAGWCKLFDDGLGGCFGDWSCGLSESWQAERQRPLTAEQRKAWQQQLHEARCQANTEQLTQQQAASARAMEIWCAARPVKTDHPYLIRKGIQPCGVRCYNGALVVPIREGEVLHSLQFIEADGQKRFLSGGKVAGCYYLIGEIGNTGTLCIAEGFATAATVHVATGLPVLVAFNAGNLLPVARAIREMYPTLSLVFCADDDAKTVGNPGLTKATEAARAVSGALAVPDFGGDRPPDVTDFNDMAALVGLEAVRDRVYSAQPVEPDVHDLVASLWPAPLPLTSSVRPESYPLDALPDTVRRAVEEVQGFTKAPVALVACSALAALSLAIQAQVDVRRAEKLEGPVGLFLLTIADSGERKSTCDGFFTKAIREYEQTQIELAQPAIKDYKAAMEVWEAKRSGIKEKIRQLAKGAKPTKPMEDLLRELEHEKPCPPRVPRLLYTDATPEALAYGLARGWPAGGVVSAEAGAVFGAHGMGKDSVMRNLALLNVLWDGGSLTVDRRTAESFTVQGARLTVALQVQEATLRSFFDRSGGLARGTGFLARFLVAWPESTQGFRPFTEAPAQWPALEAFNRQIATILGRPVPLDETGCLQPSALTMAPDAKAGWVAFHDAIERELASGGELHDVRDVASKTADNAARLAALFQVFDGGGAIDLQAFEAASRIAAWHLNESRRFFGEIVLPQEQADAMRLDSWLIEHCRREKISVVPRRDVQRNVTPAHLRQKAALDAALRELAELDRIQIIHDARRKDILVNPALLEGRGSAC